RGLFTKSPLWRGVGRSPTEPACFCGLSSLSAEQALRTPKASRRHVRRSFDTLRASDKNPIFKNQTLFFGIPKGAFYKKSPLAGCGAEPHRACLLSAEQALSDAEGRILRVDLAKC